MKKPITLLIALVLATAAATPVIAGPRDHNFAERREHQAARIEQGVERGQLTRKEAKALRKEQRRLYKLARELRHEGHLSRREARVLDRAYDEASRHIYRLKHNDLARRHVRYEGWRDGPGWGSDRRHGHRTGGAYCATNQRGGWIENF